MSIVMEDPCSRRELSLDLNQHRFSRTHLTIQAAALVPNTNTRASTPTMLWKVEGLGAPLGGAYEIEHTSQYS